MAEVRKNFVGEGKQVKSTFKNAHFQAMKAISELKMGCSEKQIQPIIIFLFSYDQHPRAKAAFQKLISLLRHILALVQKGDVKTLIPWVAGANERLNALLQADLPKPFRGIFLPKDINEGNILKCTQEFLRERVDRIYFDLTNKATKTLETNTVLLFESEDAGITAASSVIEKVKDLFRKHDYAIQWKWEGDYLFNGNFYDKLSECEKAESLLDRNDFFHFREQREKGYQIYIPVGQEAAKKVFCFFNPPGKQPRDITSKLAHDADDYISPSVRRDDVSFGKKSR